MAYADKLTTMRRVAALSSDPDTSGNIQWEGVEIEGTLLLKEVDFQATTTAVIPLEQQEDWLLQNDLRLVFQDPEGEEYWEPRLDPPKPNEAEVK